jgi:Reverse transcriptase (RNA-dependent DNA polymerase)
LIPKKGDSTRLKNWRPISLLNCFYKVISRAINSRLKKISDYITSRAQKGFTSSRYIHEVLINVASNIAHCNFNGISGAIVSIDQAKAFDTIYHGFVREAYQFFGVTDTFLNILDTLGTNRMACIILDDNSLSRNFSLGTGRPQCDCTSPLEFNAGDQILLFRIEFDPELASVYIHHFPPRNLFPVDYDLVPVQFRSESNGETNKAEGLADNSSASILFEFNSLSGLKTVLSDFSEISGLKCNFDKTNVLPVDPEIEISDEIRNLGFNFVNKITLLGFKLNKNGLMRDKMLDDVRNKIVRLINVWDRYHLSLPGRIGISKTLLISQLGYICSIVMPDDDILHNIQSLINNFVLGNVKVSRDRLYMDPASGGLGLINIKHYLIGLQSSWIKKARASTRDVWRITTRNLSQGNCFTINCNNINREAYPLIFLFADSFSRFRDVFYSIDRNGYQSYILNNDLIKRGMEDDGILDLQFFRSCGIPVNEFFIANLTVKDFFSADMTNFKSMNDLRASTGMEINLLLYIRLRHALTYFVGTCRVGNPSKSFSLSAFFRPVCGEARRFRKVLDNAIFTKKLETQPSVKTFFRLCGIDLSPDLNLGRIFGFWNNSFLTNRHREFCFKFFNNQLPINTRVSHFIDNHSRLYC